MQTYRSDVIGSLLRPEYLKEARKKRASGDLSHVDFKKIEDRAVDEAIAIQVEAGLDVITDGEMRRYAFFGHLIDAIEGYDKFGGWAIPFHDDEGNELVFKRPVVVSKLRARPPDVRGGVCIFAGKDRASSQSNACERATSRGVL